MKKDLLCTLFIFLFIFLFCEKGLSQIDSTTNLFELPIEALLNIKVSVGSNIKGLRVNETPASLFTINKEDMKLSGARHLGELLQIYLPGFMWITDEDDFIYGFRGLVQDNNSTVTLLVNGQNVGYNYNQGLASQAGIIDLNYIKRVEVMSGPGSAQFGTGPLTGVINIITEDYLENEGLTAEAGESFGTGKYNNFDFGISGKIKKLKYNIHFAAFQQLRGFKPLQGNSSWVIPGAALSYNKYFESLPGYALFTTAEYKGWDFSFFNTRNQWDPYTIDGKTQQIWETLGGKLDKTFKINDNSGLYWSSRINVVGLLERLHYDFPGNVGHTGEESLSEKLAFQFTGKSLKLSIGTDFDFYNYGKNPFSGENIYALKLYTSPTDTSITNQTMTSYISRDKIPDYIPFQAEVKAFNYGAFAEAYYKINTFHSLTASLRFSYVDVFNNKSISPRIAYLGNFENFAWKIFYTRAYRTPIDASNEKVPIGGWFRHYHNPDLRTQSIDDYEINLNYNTSKFWTEIRVFYAINKDIIQGAGSNVLFKDTTDVRRKFYWWGILNSGNISSGGFELILKFNPSKLLQIGLSHSMVKPLQTDLSIDADLFVSTEKKKFLNYPENVTRMQMTYRPFAKLTLNSSLIIDYGRLKGDPLTISLKYASGTVPNYVSSNILSDPWYNLNLNAIYNVGNNFDLAVHVINVLNSRPYWPVVFQNSFSVTSPPTSFIFSLRYRIDYSSR